MLRKSLIAIGVAAAIPAVSFAAIPIPDDRTVDPKVLEELEIDEVSWDSALGTDGNQSLINQEGYYNHAYVDQAEGNGDSDSLIYQGGDGYHIAIVEQDGTDVDSVIKQTGDSQFAHVIMSNGDSGWASRSDVFQQGGEYNSAYVTIDGSDNYSLVLQDNATGAVANVDIDGFYNNSHVYQGGLDNTADVDIVGEYNASVVHQWGDWNTATVNIQGDRNNVRSEQTAWDSDVKVILEGANDNTVTARQDASYFDNIDVLVKNSDWNGIHLNQGGAYGSSWNDINVRVRGGSDDNTIVGTQTGDFNKLNVKIRGDSDGNTVQSKQAGWNNTANIDIFAISDGNSIVTDQEGTDNLITANVDYSWGNEIGVKQDGLDNETTINLWDADYNFIAVSQEGDWNQATVDLDTDYGTVKIHQDGWGNTACSSSTGSCSYTY